MRDDAAQLVQNAGAGIRGNLDADFHSNLE
jgi:hypothetical protein